MFRFHNNYLHWYSTDYLVRMLVVHRNRPSGMRVHVGRIIGPMFTSIFWLLDPLASCLTGSLGVRVLRLIVYAVVKWKKSINILWKVRLLPVVDKLQQNGNIVKWVESVDLETTGQTVLKKLTAVCSAEAKLTLFSSKLRRLSGRHCVFLR